MPRDLQGGGGRRAPREKTLQLHEQAAPVVSGFRSPSRAAWGAGPQDFTMQRSARWSVRSKGRVARAKPPTPSPGPQWPRSRRIRDRGVVVLYAAQRPSHCVATSRRRSTGAADRTARLLSRRRAECRLDIASSRRESSALSMLDRLVRLVGRFPRAARPVHIGFPIRIWIRLIPTRIRPVGICATRHEHQRADDNDCQLCFHDDALSQTNQRKAEGPGLARGGHWGRPGPGSMRGVKEHFHMSTKPAKLEIAFV
jgi:hypothetical protein